MGFPPIPPAQLDETLWTSVVGPGNTLYTIGYKAGQDDIRFNFENDNSYVDVPMYVLWGNSAQALDQAKRDILGYPFVNVGLSGGLYVSRVTPMTILAFLQLSTGLPYLFAVQLSGTGWGVPDDGIVKNTTLSFPIYKQTKCNAHFESLTYDIFTDTQMVLLGAVDANGNPDEATLLRYVTKEVMPGMEYLTLPQGSFRFVATPGGANAPVVAGTAGKLTPNYDLSLIWEMVPQSCIGSVLYNPALQNPPIDNCLGCVNNAAFPPVVGAGNKQVATASPTAGGINYNVGDMLTLVGGLGIPPATLLIDSVSGIGAVTSTLIINPGNYVNNGSIPSPPTNPVATVTNGVGIGCTINCTFGNVVQQQLMTAFPAAAGTGYTLGDVLTLSGGTGTAAATARVIGLSSATGTGPVLALQILTRGAYQTPPTNPVSTTGGTGSGCTLTCEFGNGIPPGQLLMTSASITPIRSSAGDRLFRLAYRFKYLPQGVQMLYYQGGLAPGATISVSTVANTANPLVTTSSAHGFTVGDSVLFAGTGTALDGGTFTVATIPSTTTFTVTLSSAPGAGTGGTVAALLPNPQSSGYFEVTTNGFTNIGLGLYNNNPTSPPVNIYPWAAFANLFRVPS
jgi:hypothetical protein